jgi:hypothetical protein
MRLTLPPVMPDFEIDSLLKPRSGPPQADSLGRGPQDERPSSTKKPALAGGMALLFHETAMETEL